MNTKIDSRADDDVEEWLAIMQIGTPSAEERAAFKVWREENPSRAAAYDEAEALCEELRGLDSLKALARAAEQKRAKSPKTRAGFFDRWALSLAPFWRLAGAAAAACFIVIGAAATLYLNAPSSSAERHITETAETRNVLLADGSIIDLAPESRIEVAYTDEARRVDLLAGEAFFDVSKSDARPFIVAAGDAEVRVLGTKFNVHRGPAGVTVAVAEGEVEVRQERPLLARALRPVATPALAEHRLEAGQKVVASSKDGLDDIAEVAPQQAGSWRSGFLIYPDNSLREVIADVNRYSAKPIVIASDDVAELRIVGGFPISGIDDALSGIEDLLPVTVDRSKPNRIVIRAADHS